MPTVAGHDDVTLTDDPDAVGHRGPHAPEVRPTRIGRFTILEPLGSGGMGVVYAAYDDQLDRKVALKLLRRSGRLSPRARVRLVREARALAQLSHPNVVTIFDAGLEGDEFFIAMEFVRGHTLRTWLTQQTRSWGEILEVFVAIGEGLAAVHELGLVHRDIKPQNILIDERGRARLIDFGLAREHEEGDVPPMGPTDALPTTREQLAEPASAGSTTSTFHGPLTRAGALLGTPQYMSPEQFEHREVTPRSDQFALCVCLYEALFGCAPFEGEHPHSRAAFVLEGTVREPPPDAGVPEELSAVVLRGLRRDPEQRWPDLAALLVALRGLLAAYDPELEKPSSLRFRRNLLFLLLAVIATTLVGFGVVAEAVTSSLNAANVLVLDAILTPTIGVTAALLRRRWTLDRQSRRLVGLILLMTVIYVAQDLTGWLTGRSLYHTTLGSAVCFTAVCLFMVPLTSNALLGSAAWAAAWTLMMVLDPARFYIYFHVANIGAATIATVWLPRRVIDRWIRAAASQRGSGSSRATPPSSADAPSEARRSTAAER